MIPAIPLSNNGNFLILNEDDFFLSDRNIFIIGAGSRARINFSRGYSISSLKSLASKSAFRNALFSLPISVCLAMM